MKQNKKESVAALHRTQILSAAEHLFSDKGFNSTSIDDISKTSGYSRRTIYAYFINKDDISCHIILRGLQFLKDKLIDAIKSDSNFVKRYQAICQAMSNYYYNSPYSFETVIRMQNKNLDLTAPSRVVSDILVTGDEINKLLEAFIEDGKKQNMVVNTVNVKPTVFILWSSISSLLMLAENKGQYIAAAMNTTLEEFLDYGFNQIVNSILVERQ